MSDFNENEQGGNGQQPYGNGQQPYGQASGASPTPPNSYYHYQGAGPGGQAHANATDPAGFGSPYAQPTGGNGAQPQPAKPKKSHSGAKTFGIAFAGAALACVLVIGGAGVVNTATSGSPSGSTTVLGGTSSTSTSGSADENATLAESVSQKCLPSVVAIDVYTNQQSGYYGYSTGNSLTETSLGSGVVLSSDGYIITNYHVIEGSDALKVTIEGNEYDADIVGSDPSSDIAVIKAKDASGLTPMDLGDSDNLTVGEWVMSIGSPFGLEQSVATGIVSATNRSQIMDNSSSSNQYSQQQSNTTTVYTNMIQTDAAINPGNSGGALVDKDGKLIGINTLITSYSGNYSGVGFAIPVNYAVNLAQQIIEGKTPTHAQMGVSLSTINSQTAKRYGLSVDEGAYIAAVSSGSGAESAGIKVGDIVTAFDGKKVTSASDLMLDVRSKNPGDTVTVTINRDGQSQDVQVTLGSDENSQASSNSGTSQGNSSNGGSLEELLRQYGFGGGSNSSGTSASAGTSAQAA